MLQISGDIFNVAFGVSIALFLRLCTSLHPYSGQGQSPMFGDYEAQRHWMEITLNLPMNQWYHNTTTNDLNYWGLDYPPLTAYHSYLMGIIAWLINPAFVQLQSSRGFESEQHKLFMRYTVLMGDILIYIPSVVAFYALCTRRLFHGSKLPLAAITTIALLYPGMILIDHGHFQYNCISLGLCIAAVTAIILHWDIAGSILFCLAVNYKQMELYHALPFFFYLLSACIPKPGASAVSGIVKLFQLGITVLLTFSFLWLPFLLDKELAFQVLHRVFPIARGIFEDKVANVWCIVNVVYKLRQVCPSQMLRYCTLCTLGALLPSLANLFLSPNVKKLLPALINSSLSFYLFSFQVHEKSILLAAVPVLLYLPVKPLECFWFLQISSFSLLPLLIKDKLVVAYCALKLFYITAFVYVFRRFMDENYAKPIRAAWEKCKRKIKHHVAHSQDVGVDVIKSVYDYFIADLQILKGIVLIGSFALSQLGSLVLTVVTLTFDTPDQLPDLYSLAIAAYCCVHFLGFLVFFNVVQFQIPQSFDAITSRHDVNTCTKLKHS